MSVGLLFFFCTFAKYKYWWDVKIRGIAPCLIGETVQNREVKRALGVASGLGSVLIS